MGKLFIHIGLPKTATSTLQVQLFDEINSERLVYLGIKHPRSSKQNELYSLFYKSIQIGENIDFLRERLQDKLKTKDILLSEEGIVLNDNFANWKIKLENLSKIVKNLNSKIIITVREPAIALFSYYIELYGKIKWEGSFYNIAMNNDSMKIYHYAEFLKYCEIKFGKENIHIIRFEDIIDNNISDLINILGIEKFKKSFSNINSKSKKGNKIITNSRTSLGNVLVRIVRTLRLNKIRFLFFFKGFYSILLNKTNNIILKKDTVRTISSVVLDQLRSDLKADIEYLRDNYNIDYTH